jgi:hypothetical protein
MSNSNDPAKLAFVLRGCGDLLEKLRYETGGLSATERHDVMGRAYTVFNCAVTAWHMTDWVWAELDPKQREEAQRLAGTDYKIKETDPRPLQAYARNVCEALKLCELIANGSKHYVLRSPDALVSTGMTDGEGKDYGNPIVTVDGNERLVGDVLWQAVYWWETFLANWRVAEEPPFVPDGD